MRLTLTPELPFNSPPKIQSLSRHSEWIEESENFLTFIFHWIYKYINEFKNH